MSTSLKARFEKQWPRYIVGLHSFGGLLQSVYPLVFGLQFVSTHPLRRATHGASSLFSAPSPDEDIIKNIFFVALLFSAVIYSIALYAAVRNSLAATKVSFVIWCFLTGLLVFDVVIMGLSYWLNDARQQLPPLELNVVLTLVFSLAVHFLYGWSLLVMLRDLRGQARNAWGCLTGYLSSSTDAGPIHI